MENSWLVFSVNLYDFSVKRQQIAPKKIYCIDSGLANAVGFGFSPNTGKLLENLVFLALRRQSQEIKSLDTPAARGRDLRALAEAARAIKVQRALILSAENEDGMEVNGVPVEVRSTAERLLA